MVKTNKKSLIAMIAMVVLLIASIAMGITGAWFTDKDATAGKTMTFGTLNIKAVSETMAITNTIANTSEILMPGSAISGKLKIEYEGTADAWIRYRLVVSGEAVNYVTISLTGADEEDSWVYTDNAGVKNEIDLSGNVSNSIDNSAQGLAVTFVIEVEAIQKSNTADTAKAAFTKVGTVTKYDPQAQA